MLKNLSLLKFRIRGLSEPKFINSYFDKAVVKVGNVRMSQDSVDVEVCRYGISLLALNVRRFTRILDAIKKRKRGKIK